jgi:hypothetical protein
MDCPLGLAAGATARLSYGANFTHEKLQLLEVDEELLQEIISTGVVIKGAPTDEAVLCTASKTYSLKQVETSNTLLLIPPAVRPPRCAGARGEALTAAPRRRAEATRPCRPTVRPCLLTAPLAPATSRPGAHAMLLARAQTTRALPRRSSRWWRRRQRWLILRLWR